LSTDGLSGSRSNIGLQGKRRHLTVLVRNIQKLILFTFFGKMIFIFYAMRLFIIKTYLFFLLSIIFGFTSI